MKQTCGMLKKINRFFRNNKKKVFIFKLSKVNIIVIILLYKIFTNNKLLNAKNFSKDNHINIILSVILYVDFVVFPILLNTKLLLLF